MCDVHDVRVSPYCSSDELRREVGQDLIKTGGCIRDRNGEVIIHSESHVLLNVGIDVYWLDGNDFRDNNLSPTIVLALLNTSRGHKCPFYSRADEQESKK
jgi:hypothetical protein